MGELICATFALHSRLHADQVTVSHVLGGRSLLIYGSNPACQSDMRSDNHPIWDTTSFSTRLIAALPCHRWVKGYDLLSLADNENDVLDALSAEEPRYLVT